jgi:hypothetical protein
MVTEMEFFVKQCKLFAYFNACLFFGFSESQPSAKRAKVAIEEE